MRRNQHMQPGPQLIRYLDDVAILAPEAPVAQAREPYERRPGEALYAAGIPPPAPRPQREALPRPVVRDFEELRREAMRREAERRVLDLPPQPPMVINPDWGPPPAQPPLRYLRTERTEWGGEASALHHDPPPNLRRDFFQLDENRFVLIRWHVRARVRLFVPDQAILPAPLEQRALTGQRRTLVTTPNRRYFIDDDYRGLDNQRTLPAQWRGRTEFQIDEAIFRQLQPALAFR